MYIRRGGWGGKRHTGPVTCGHCGKMGHNASAHRGCGAISTVELGTDGRPDVWRVICPKCGPVYGGTIEPGELRRLVQRHMHRTREGRRQAAESRQMEMG